MTKITQFDTDGIQSNSNGLTRSNSNDRLTAVVAGDYRVTLALSIGEAAGITYTAQVYKNGVTALANLRAAAEVITANKPVGMFISGVITLAASDYIELFAKADTAAQDFLIHEGNFSMQKVG
jgi:hypothetical protein